MVSEGKHFMQSYELSVSLKWCSDVSFALLVLFDVDKLIDFPGFNIRPPDGTLDVC